jgi:hypothetical protein
MVTGSNTGTEAGAHPPSLRIAAGGCRYKYNGIDALMGFIENALKRGILTLKAYELALHL